MKAMHLYTVILDYRGGTYIAQVEATSENEALRAWISALQTDRIADDVSEEVGSAFGANPEAVVPLGDLAGAWYAGARAGQGYAGVNIVKTVA